MKLFKNALFLRAVVCVFAACKKGGPSADDMAKKACDCAAPLLEMSDKMASASPDEKEALIKDYQTVTETSMKCMEALSKDIKLEGDALAKYETAYQAALKSACPKLSQMLNPQS